MARFDYLLSQVMVKKDPTFTAIIMTAMRKADSLNLARLKHAWPEIWKELQARYNAPGGWLRGEINNDGEVVK